MDKHIFLLDDRQQLVSMAQQGYDSEDLLQELLANYPELMASDQIGYEPRRWILVSRETPIPDRDDNTFGRWSLDHLFLDQDGIPTLVEVKRSTDSRIRREVVGQMLDYAANAVTYWKVDEIRTRFELGLGEVDPAEFLSDQLGITSTNIFWQMVETNLRAGKIRMIFVADEIPDELRRIVEFLNEQMSPAEVIAIAIRQYVGTGLRTLVPTLYGNTAKAHGAKSSGEEKKWTEETFFSELVAHKGQKIADMAYQILNWAYTRGLRVWWGEGKKLGSFVPLLDVGSENHFSIGVWTNGRVEVQFQYMLNRSPFEDESRRQEFLTKLNAIGSVHLPPDSLTRRPSFPLTAFHSNHDIEQLIAVLDWFIETVYQHNW